MRIEFHRTFKKRYRKIPKKVREHFDARLLLFGDNPFHPMLGHHALHGERRGQWSINITGDWRALYEFIDENVVIFVEIDTHGNLYR